MTQILYGDRIGKQGKIRLGCSAAIFDEDIVDRDLRRERIMSMAGMIGIGVLQALILLLVAPVFSGFSRVLRAKMQTRKGPPLMQNYRDIVKLMKRQEVVSEQAGWIFRITPYASMAAMLLVALIVPMLAAASAITPSAVARIETPE